jgi:hypothetical protein
MAPPFLTSVADGSEWSTPRPGRFTRYVKGPRYPFDGRLRGDTNIFRNTTHTKETR